MFIPHLRLVCLTFILSSLFATALLAETEIYKWLDKDGQTNYSQQAPLGIPSTLMKAPPPPAMDPNVAQQKLDELIGEQKAEEQIALEQQHQQQNEEENQDIQQKNCDIAQKQLQQYQDNPGRRMIDAEGNVTRLTEDERQQKIKESQENVTKYCK